MLTEGLVLAGLGGVAGVLASPWAAPRIPQLLSTRWQDPPLQVEFNGSVLVVSLVMTLFQFGAVWQYAWSSRRHWSYGGRCARAGRDGWPVAA